MLLIRRQDAANSSVRAGSAVLALIGRRPITQLTIHAGDHAKEVRKLLSPITAEGGCEHCWRDNVSMKVDTVFYFNVVNPERVVVQVQKSLPATNMLAQTILRAVLGQHELDEMLAERKNLSEDVQSNLDAQTETRGIRVANVEIRTVELTQNIVRAIAKQAENALCKSVQY